MQNKANFQKSQMNVNPYNTTDYERNDIFAVPENKANSNPNKANLLDAQMNVNKVLTKDYRKNDAFAVQKNKPKTNPISKAKKCPGTVISHYFKQFEKKLVTARQSRDYLENRERGKRNKSFSFS